MIEISKAEEMVLLAIWRLGNKAYGVPVRRQIRKNTGKDYTYGTLYGILRQLEHKGFIQKKMGDPLPKKGGRSKAYFKITPEGIQALKDAIVLYQRVWKDINEYSLDKS